MSDDPLKAFTSQYTAALEDFLSGAGEVALRNAYELGRQALSYESGILVVTAAHHKALHAALLRGDIHQGDTLVVKQAADFLAECLSPFEMARRGFQESIATLHKQQQDLRLLLSPMPNLLLTVDDRDCLAALFVPAKFPAILRNYQVGMALGSVLPAELNAPIMTALQEVRQSGQMCRLENSLIIDGQIFHFDFQISPVTNSRDVLLVVNNITERKEIELAEHRQRVLAEALRDTALALNSSLDLDEVLNRIVANIGRVVPHDVANIVLVEGEVARIVRTYGLAEHSISNFEAPTSKVHLSTPKTATLYKVVQTKESVIVSDLKSYAKQNGNSELGLMGSAVSTPILSASSVIGIINLISLKRDFFTSVHVDNLQIFASQAAVAIQNAHLFEQAQEAAALNERQRLARDLHDSVSQSLFSASIIAESLPRLWERSPEKVFPLILDLHQLIKSSAAEMRVLLWELRPANLLANTLENLLTQLVSAVQWRAKMKIVCTVEGDQSLPEDVHIAFYRIAQESLNNIVKHSAATEASINLYSLPEKTILRVRDNGRGFSLDGSAAGFGLGNMSERAQMIGASLEIMSQHGRGTEITVTWIPETMD